VETFLRCEKAVLGLTERSLFPCLQVCQAASFLAVSAQARLARVWAKHSRDRLKELLVSLQQLVTLKVISGSFSREHCVQEDDAIAAATKLMKVSQQLICKPTLYKSFS